MNGSGHDIGLKHSEVNMEVTTEESGSPSKKTMKTGDVPPGDGDCDKRMKTMDLPDDNYDSDRGMTDEEYKTYSDQVKKSDGFDVDDFPVGDWFGVIQPMDIHKQDDEWSDYDRCSRLSVDEYNRRFKGELKFVKVLKVMGRLSNLLKYYITFEAKDFADGAKIKVYQAKVLVGLEVVISVLSFRLKPPEDDQGSGNHSREWFWNNSRC